MSTAVTTVNALGIFQKVNIYKVAKVVYGNRHSSGAVCVSRGGRPGLSVLTSLLVSVDVKLY